MGHTFLVDMYIRFENIIIKLDIEYFIFKLIQFPKEVKYFVDINWDYRFPIDVHPWLAKQSNQVFRHRKRYFSRGSSQPKLNFFINGNNSDRFLPTTKVSCLFTKHLLTCGIETIDGTEKLC